jgi:filamentous hemagglutinin family protein
MKLVSRSLGIGSLVFHLMAAHAVSAQIVPDNTLPVNSRVDAGCTRCTIEGGTVRGTNLFHSFREFSVPTGGAAIFNNAIQIQNILARVTGSSVSTIDGLLQARGTANLFLLNPNGVIFEPNARLDVRGSFVTTTADAIAFPNGETFSASNPTQPSPLLTINPNALFFNQLNPQPIINRSIADTTGLTTAPGQNLAFVGGDVRLEGGRIRAAGGRVELGGLSAPGTVGLNITQDNLSLSFPNTVARADVLLNNDAQVNVRAGDGGDVVIHARNLTMSGLNTQLLAGISSGLGFIGAQAGDIEIDASENIHLDGSVIFNQARPGAIGNGGNITIRTGSINGINSAAIITSTTGQGNAGDITINARNTITFDGERNGLTSGIFSIVSRGAVGNGGDINITARVFSLTNGAVFNSRTEGQGNAGDIIINASDTVLFSGVSAGSFPFQSGINSGVFFTGVGRGGDITITTGSLFVTNGGGIGANTDGQGNAGDIVIRARDRVIFDGVTSNGFYSVLTSATRSTVGDGGNVTIQTESLSITNGAVLSALTNGQGRAGNVLIDADQIEISGSIVAPSPRGAIPRYSSISTASANNATGEGGDIQIRSNRLQIAGGLLDARTFGSQRGGDIQVNANTIELTGGGEIITTAFSRGDAGNIRINASDRVVLSGFDPEFEERSEQFGEDLQAVSASSGLFAQTKGTGQAGDIFVQAPQLIVRDQAQILASTAEASRGGNIQLTIPNRLLLETDGQISASARSGTAGSLDVIAGAVELSGNSLLSVEAGQGGIAGDLNIAARRLTVNNSSVTVSNPQGQAGTLTIRAGDIQLRDRAKLIAEAGGDNQAGITQQAGIQLLDVNLLLLRDGSLISARAGDSANGGNITINAANGFVVAVLKENSDIIASANRGNGGRIDITAQAIFGLQVSDRLSPFSDINASSEFGISGVISINTLNVDPSQGLVELPTNLVDASRVVAVGCAPDVASQPNRGEFYQTGRGGIAPSPIASVGSSDILEDLQPPQSWMAITQPNPKIIEAQAIEINDRGEILLVAAPTPRWRCGR